MLIKVFCPVFSDVRYTFPWVPSNLTVYVGDSVKVSLHVHISFHYVSLCDIDTILCTVYGTYVRTYVA